MINKGSNINSYLVKIQGVVQGVGFRPYISKKANELNIYGWIKNVGGGILMEIEGISKNISIFLKNISKNPPKLAIIDRIDIQEIIYKGYSKFEILKSVQDTDVVRFVPYDAGICEYCQKEIFDKTNKRYMYPFTNCTYCGPRYSVMLSFPFDRISTTMESFSMCKECGKEYLDIDDRRFHSQTNCCGKCGPSIKILDRNGEEIDVEDKIETVKNYIKSGHIIAVKGIGGFHLVCDAKNNSAIEKLRKRKNRPHKPLAIMASEYRYIEGICYVNKKEEELIKSNKKPIVLLKKRKNNIISSKVSNSLKKYGIFLPYTPLHMMLFDNDIRYLVMTSGNISSANIEYLNENATLNLKDIADYYLVNDRDINIPVEDSVVRVVNNKEIVVRRSRGYSPYVIKEKIDNEIISLGSEQKNSFCISKNGYIYMSQYFGNITDYKSFCVYKKGVENLKKLLDAKPEFVACDLSTKKLPDFCESLKIIKVQHHHAHMVSCMSENNIYDDVIGVVFDGTGLGDDNCIWGGEFLVGNRFKYTRVGQIEYVDIQGGDLAIKEPWRIALSYLHSMNIDYKKYIKAISDSEILLVEQALNNGLNCFKTSSVGRSFDCVSALLELCCCSTYEAQAAIQLENIASKKTKDKYNYNIKCENGYYEVGYKTIIEEILKDIDMKLSKHIISAKFRNTIVQIILDMVKKINLDYKINKVVLSGGVFDNDYLLKNALKGLKNIGMEVYSNGQIPSNDNGISVGQISIAEEIIKRGNYVY